MGRDYTLKCIECGRKVEKIFEKHDTFEGIELAKEIDDIYFLTPNYDVEIDNMKAINLEKMLEWIKTHSAHSEIAFEVGT